MNSFWYKNTSDALCLKLAGYSTYIYGDGLTEDACDIREYIDVTITPKFDYPMTKLPFGRIEQGGGFFYNSMFGIKISDTRFIDLIKGELGSCCDPTLRVFTVSISIDPRKTEIVNGRWYLTSDGPAFAFEQLLWIIKSATCVCPGGVRILRPLDTPISFKSVSACRVRYANMEYGQTFLCGDSIRLKTPQGSVDLITGKLDWYDDHYHTVEIEIND